MTTINPTFDFRTIKTFDDACSKENIFPTFLHYLRWIPAEFRKPIFAYYKLLVIYKAINNGWRPDWSNYEQNKYYPWFEVLSSGFGFSYSHYYYDFTSTFVGSRLCTDTGEKAIYIAEQFQIEYQDFLLYSEEISTESTETNPAFDFRTIKTFEDARIKENIFPTFLHHVRLIPTQFRKPIIAYYKLLIIYKAINNGWRPDWSNSEQNKYYPWFEVLSSGFGFSASDYDYDGTLTAVGSRLCTDSEEKIAYIAEQFKVEYQKLFLYSEYNKNSLDRIMESKSFQEKNVEEVVPKQVREDVMNNRLFSRGIGTGSISQRR